MRFNSIVPFQVCKIQYTNFDVGYEFKLIVSMSLYTIYELSLQVQVKVVDIKSNLVVKYNGMVGRLKPCRIKIEGAWESRKGREEGRPCLVQESLESVKRGRIDNFHREFIPRDGKSHREGCFLPE